jgi:hypothetical protein
MEPPTLPRSQSSSTSNNTTLSTKINWDVVYVQQNRNTGETLDLRDVNKASFINDLIHFHSWSDREAVRETKHYKHC